MVPAHMDAYGSLESGCSLTASLNPAFVNPFDAPHIQAKGHHVGGDGYLQGLGDSQGGASCADMPPSVAGAEGLGLTFSDS